ncbi:hypothetical protein HYX07_01465 [Candidatus Woesearchaeota archaeon]|nr:hypothetical protein [Candidatus Woesearchaeota archaeon]
MGDELAEDVRMEFLRRSEADSARRLSIAQRHYDEWLASQAIKDPKAEVAVSRHLGYVGVVGSDSSRPHGRAYDILPTQLVISINVEIGNSLPTNGPWTFYSNRFQNRL